MSEVLAASFLQEGRLLLEKHLDQLLQNRPELPFASLFTAARYSLLSEAKRLRPLLVLATASTYGIPLEKALQPACALEMVHTYSLIHDDLPCMDDDDLRRGKPTLHKVYPEGHAVLAGDYLLTYAFELLATSPHLNDTQRIGLVQTLATHAGAHGMIGGQVIDLASENRTLDWPTLELMHRYKTAGLITVALDFGALIVDLPKEKRALLQNVGTKIGIAFQIVDDILDGEETPEMGSDQKKKKATALSLMTPFQCHAHAEALLSSALKDLAQLSPPTPLLAALLHQLVHRDK